MKKHHYIGRVVKGAGHTVYLRGVGFEYNLRHAGGDFQDPQLDALVGKTIDCLGIIKENALIMVSWEEV